MTNPAAFLLDTIKSTPFDITAARLMSLRSELGPLFGALEPGLSSEGQKDAYHTIPNAQSQLGFCVIAFLDVDVSPARMRFCISWGHVFGFKSAVNYYNRVPEFCICV